MRVGVIFAAFVLVLSVSNVSLLVRFYSLKEKKHLKEQLLVIDKLNINNISDVSSTLSDISDSFNFDVEIYNKDGIIIYTTHGSQMMDYFNIGNDRFKMIHEPLTPIKTEHLGDGVIYQNATRSFGGEEFLLCYKEIEDNIFAEVRIQKELITNSAQIANEFIFIVSSICFALSLVWVFVFAHKFSKPIVEMNEITRDMSNLNFTRRLKVSGSDEIGQLAASINDMSASLSVALEDLKKTNSRLRDEIELERQLDVMRRGFVANVSHELKTPIAIISGYAEGLKLNINAASREDYLNTIIDESNRMNRLVLSILELSRYEAGQMPLEKQSFDISEMAGDMLRRIFADKNVETINEIPPGSIVFADPVQIEQVLKSYLENAAAHTPEGGSVRIAGRNNNDGFRVSVFNTGSRVDEEIMPQIWQSFFRGDKSHKRENSRFGLGLSIVSAIMKLHGRTCGVYNTEDGVCFWFEVDRTQEDPQP